MGVLDRFLDAIKLNDDEDDYLDDDELLEADDMDDEFLDDDLEERPKKSFLDRFGKSGGASRKKASIREEDDDLDDYDDELLEDEKPDKKPRTSLFSKKSSTSLSDDAPASRLDKEKPLKRTSKITPMRSPKSGSASNVEVCVIKPTSFENTQAIADALLDNSTVILNLEGIDVELAQRIIDFTAGSCYSLGGSLQQVSSYIFILGPFNVEITGDLKNILGGASVVTAKAGY